MSPMTLAIAGLVLAWALQGLGTYYQIRHYAAAMGEVTRSWEDGFVGTGRSRSRFGAGTLLLLVVDADRVVRRLLVMRGVTVLARFVRRREAEGLSLSELERDPSLVGGVDPAALAIAATQIDAAAARARGATAAA